MSKKNLITISVSIGLVLIFMPPEIVLPFAIVIIGLLIGIFLIFFKEPEKPRILLKIFIAGFALRLAICILLAFISYLKRGHVFFLGADDFGFSWNAIRIVEVWKRTGYLPEPNSLRWMHVAGNLNYSYWLSFLYYFIGEYTLMPLFINCSFGASSIIFIYLVAKELFNYKIALSSALFFAFWPSLVMWSTQNLREPLTTFFILVVFLCIIKLQQRFKKINCWIILLISFLILMKLRISIAILLFISAFFTLIFFSKNKKNIVFYSLLSIFICIFIINQPHLNKILSKPFGVTTFNSLLELLNHHHQVKTISAETAFLTNVDISTLPNFIFYLPRFLLYIFFAPFPWQIFKLSQAFAVFEMVLWYFLVILALRGIFLTIRYKFKNAFILLFFSWIMLFASFTEGNVGTLFRHRALTWPCVFIFISLALFYNKKDFEINHEAKLQK